MILSIVNIKGGSARTTTAMFLASAYIRLGYEVTVVDTDYQESATKWAARVRDTGQPLLFPVHSCALTTRVLRTEPDKVEEEITRLDAPGAMTILDTTSATPEIMPVISKISDFALVPFATSPVDYQATLDTLRSLTIAHAVVMTRVDCKKREEEQMRQRFQEDGVHVLKAKIPYREAYRRVYVPTPRDGLRDHLELAAEITPLRKKVNKETAEQLWERG